MSKLFFDNLLNLESIDKKIKSLSTGTDEKEEMWLMVDEIVHHKVMGCILANLPRVRHEEFLKLYHSAPHDEETIFTYLTEKIGGNIKELILREIGATEEEILNEIGR